MSTQDSTAPAQAAPETTVGPGAPEPGTSDAGSPGTGTSGTVDPQGVASGSAPESPGGGGPADDRAEPDGAVSDGAETDVLRDEDVDAQDALDGASTNEDTAKPDAPTGQNVTQVTRSSRSEDLVREGEVAADFLETLLDIADLDGDLEVDVEGNRAAVAIVDSEDGVAPRRLVGPGGSVLEALQELTRLAVQAETGDRSRLMLDVAGYRADRRAALVKSAQAAIAEVKDSGARRELEPMTAFERKVIHDEVLAAGLHSESEGAEPSRYVVILPAR